MPVCPECGALLSDGALEGVLGLGSFRSPPFAPSLQILDVIDPVHPQLLGSAYITGSLMAVGGTQAVIGSWDNEQVIQIVDFTDQTTPVLIGTFHTPDEIQEVALRAHNLFLADLGKGLVSLELSAQLRVGVPSLSPRTSTLRWTGAPGVVLQQTRSFASPVWQDVDGTDGRSQIDLPRSEQPVFYRAARR